MTEELQKIAELSGQVTHIVYRNEQTFYTVCRIRIQDEREKTVTAVGIMPGIEIDMIYTFHGIYKEHPRYGLQLQIIDYAIRMPDDNEAVIRYLSGIQFPGIGKKTAERIVAALGINCLDDIRSDPSILLGVPGLNEDKIKTITDGLLSADSGMDELVRFLNVRGIGMRNLIRLNRAYGKEALVKIKENPYRVIDEVDGFGFKTADEIAMSLGFSEDDERRLYALLVSLCMKMCFSEGDSWVDADDLKDQFTREAGGREDCFDHLLEEAMERRSLVQEGNRIYPVTQYDAEDTIAEFLSEFPYKKIEIPETAQLSAFIVAMQQKFNISYDGDQIKAIETFFQVPFSIITGGPGTGKTTVIRAMADLCRLLYPGSSVICAAPTGRAAKRLSELTDTHSVTLHSLLKWDLETNTFGKNENDPIEADLLIIDEFSMVDQFLFANLLKASKGVGRICVIGDEDQLPSVSPGCVLRDLIASTHFPVQRLTHIYRQREGSDVISLAQAIHEGNVDFSSYTHDVAFIENHDMPIRDQVLSIVRNALDKGYEINDIQVLSPMYGGNAGIDLLNNALQEAFNPRSPQKREIHVGYTTLREGDKILQLKNQPDDDVYNGDIGILEEIVQASETGTGAASIVVDYEGCYVEYSPENFSNITLAYCISIHKSQGSEYPIVIMPITRQQSVMLQRNLIYTGVTRARQSLILLGDKEAFNRGIRIAERHERRTTLSMRMDRYEEMKRFFEEG